MINCTALPVEYNYGVYVVFSKRKSSIESFRLLLLQPGKCPPTMLSTSIPSAPPYLQQLEAAESHNEYSLNV